MRRIFSHLGRLARRSRDGWIAGLLPDAAPLDLRILGRTLLHAALVGAAAGLMGALFFFGLDLVQRVLLEDLCGYVPLRAHGEGLVTTSGSRSFRPYLRCSCRR